MLSPVPDVIASHHVEHLFADISTGAPSLNTKKKIAATNRMALQPHRRISHSTSGSLRSKAI